MEERLIIPFPLKASTQVVKEIESRRFIHVLKAVFVGVGAHYSKSHNSSNYGPIVGVQIPLQIGLRLWAGYNMGRTMDLKRDYVLDQKVAETNGYRIGAGIKFKYFSLDLEYQVINNDENAINNAYLLSVSVPLSL